MKALRSIAVAEVAARRSDRLAGARARPGARLALHRVPQAAPRGRRTRERDTHRVVAGELDARDLRDTHRRVGMNEREAHVLFRYDPLGVESERRLRHVEGDEDAALVETEPARRERAPAEAVDEDPLHHFAVLLAEPL